MAVRTYARLNLTRSRAYLRPESGCRFGCNDLSLSRKDVHLVSTVRVLLRPAVYRILFAMGGVEVVELRSAEDGLVLATLVLTDSMLAFVRRLDGVRDRGRRAGCAGRRRGAILTVQPRQGKMGAANAAGRSKEGL